MAFPELADNRKNQEESGAQKWRLITCHSPIRCEPVLISEVFQLDKLANSILPEQSPSVSPLAVTTTENKLMNDPFLPYFTISRILDWLSLSQHHMERGVRVCVRGLSLPDGLSLTTLLLSFLSVRKSALFTTVSSLEGGSGDLNLLICIRGDLGSI